MVQKFTNLKQQIPKLLQLLYVQNDNIDNMNKTGYNVYVYDFSVDYDATHVDDIVDIHNYLMKKTT